MLRKDFVVTQLPGVGGARARRGRRPAHRRGPGAGGAGLPRRARRVARDDAPGRGARRGGGRAGPWTPAPGSSGSTPATSRRSRSTAVVRRARAADPQGLPARSPSPASAARTTCSSYAREGAHAVLVGESLVTGKDPRSRRRRPRRGRVAPRAAGGPAVTHATEPRSDRRPPARCATPGARTSAASAAGSCPRRSSPRSTSSTPRSPPRAGDPAFRRRARDRCTAPTPAARASSPRCPGSPSTPAARASSSSARTSTTPARTRSTTSSARRC